jgi:hypothetical protein
VKKTVFNIIAQCVDLNDISALIPVAEVPLHYVKTSATAGYPAHV